MSDQVRHIRNDCGPSASSGIVEALLQEQREFGKVKNRDEHEEADEEGGGDVLDDGLRLG